MLGTRCGATFSGGIDGIRGRSLAGGALRMPRELGGWDGGFEPPALRAAEGGRSEPRGGTTDACFTASETDPPIWVS